MKRRIVMTIMILTTLTVSAQGKWTETQYDSDELTGVSAYTAIGIMKREKELCIMGMERSSFQTDFRDAPRL